ncbi:hypothetical protein [Methylobacterium sp. J-090]|uniref:hypothetical protein n=1 Tax=Methylobacterium sp. J-090 TaxID=2836666 RepID=UPI001FBA5CCC|nr:hypothetical protein [Methylobacterium sp. J-090]MCJ2084313.1 hypothetical protein [Methylobacterium sp. J-090]
MHVAEIVTYPGTALIGHVLHTLNGSPEDRTMKTADRSMTYPEFVRFRTEHGISGAIVQAARQSRITTSEFLRQAVRAKLAADGIALPALDELAPRQAA